LNQFHWSLKENIKARLKEWKSYRIFSIVYHNDMQPFHFGRVFLFVMEM